MNRRQFLEVACLAGAGVATAGCPYDGCDVDSDGDGIPDCKDSAIFDPDVPVKGGVHGSGSSGGSIPPDYQDPYN